MKKSLFDLPQADADFQIHDHGYWIRHQDNWWRAAWIIMDGQHFNVMYQPKPKSGFRFAGRVTTLTEAEKLMKKMGKKGKPYG